MYWELYKQEFENYHLINRGHFRLNERFWFITYFVYDRLVVYFNIPFILRECLCLSNFVLILCIAMAS